MKKIFCLVTMLCSLACAGRPTAAETRTPAQEKGTGQVDSSNQPNRDIMKVDTGHGLRAAVLEEVCTAKHGKVIQEKDEYQTSWNSCSGGEYDGYKITDVYINDDCKARYDDAREYFDKTVNNAADELGLLTVTFSAVSACQNYSEEHSKPTTPIIRNSIAQCRKNASQVSFLWLASCYLKAADFAQHVMKANQQ